MSFVKLWSFDRSVKKFIAFSSGESFQQFLVKAAEKLSVSKENGLKLVLESDGTEIDDIEVMSYLGKDAAYLLLCGNEKWTSATAINEATFVKGTEELTSHVSVCPNISSPTNSFILSPSSSACKPINSFFQWAESVDIDLHDLPSMLLQRLINSVSLNKKDRACVISVIVERFCIPSPGRRALRLLCSRLCERYPSLKPVEMMLVKVEEKMYNKQRKHDHVPQPLLNRSNDDATKSTKKPRIDEYGCIAFQPSIENEMQLHEAADKFLRDYTNTAVEIDGLQSLFDRCFPLQRKDIVLSLYDGNIHSLMEKWPMLQEEKWLLRHFQLLTGFCSMSRLHEHFDEVASEVLQFFQEKQLVKGLRFTEFMSVEYGFMCCLIHYFKEQEFLRVINGPVSDRRVVQNLAQTQDTVCLVFEEGSTSNLLATHVVWKTCVWRCQSIKEALGVLFAASYTFHLTYAAPNTLEFIQRLCLHLNPAKPCSKSRKIGTKHGFVMDRKLLSLIDMLHKHYNKYII